MPDALPAPSLEALLARAEDLALFSMRARGSVAPTLLALGAGGPICFIPSSLKDERAKDQFAQIARLICLAHAATAAVMAIDAKSAVQDVPYTKLRERLRKDGQVLSYVAPTGEAADEAKQGKKTE